MPSLAAISLEIERCRTCRRGKTGLPVPGEGNSLAKIVFIGEAPGPNEAKTGRPFVGRSGRLLTAMLEGIGVDRKRVFITSPVKYYPGPRPPTPREIKHGTTHLRKQLAAIRPKLIVLLGAVAHRALLGRADLTRTHGTVITEGGQRYFSTFHPAAAMRFPRVRRLMSGDFKKLKKFAQALR